MDSQTKYLIDQYHLSDDVKWDQVDSLIPYYKLVEYMDNFLIHLKSDHEVPGKVYAKLLGIGQWIRENKIITTKQHRYVTLAIIGYWHEIEDEYRYYL
jgi:hypothetical protein